VSQSIELVFVYFEMRSAIGYSRVRRSDRPVTVRSAAGAEPWEDRLRCHAVVTIELLRDEGGELGCDVPDGVGDALQRADVGVEQLVEAAVILGPTGELPRRGGLDLPVERGDRLGDQIGRGAPIEIGERPFDPFALIERVPTAPFGAASSPW
jgi:hypothetical protein